MGFRSRRMFPRHPFHQLRRRLLPRWKEASSSPSLIPQANIMPEKSGGRLGRRRSLRIVDFDCSLSESRLDHAVEDSKRRHWQRTESAVP